MNTDRYDIEYNEDTGKNHGVLMYDYPQIQQAAKNYETYRVPGRNGEMISDREYLSNIKLSCSFSVISSNFIYNIRDLKRWLSGMGKLRLSDSPETYYEVLKIEYDSIERELRKFGRFNVVFICYPYEFLDNGQVQMNLSDVTYNPYDRCMPLYHLSGEGECTLTVNRSAITANIGQNLTIDTRRQIAYREDGELMNTTITGDYEKMWLPHGENEISVTDGFQLKIVPRWGYDA